MKFTTTQNDMMTAIKTIKTLVPKKQMSLFILENIMLEVRNDQLTMLARDIDIEMDQDIPASDIEKGCALVNFKKLESILKSMKKADVINFELNNDKLHINCDGINFSIETGIISDYPLKEIEPGEHYTTVGAVELLEGFKKTAYAMAKQDVRFYLNGMLLRFYSDKLKLVSTDGHRMAFHDIDGISLDNSIEGEHIDFIICHHTVNLLIKLLDKSDDCIKIVFSKNNVQFICGKHSIKSKLVDAKYPNFDSVIPKYSNKNILSINKDRFNRACKMAKSNSNEKYSGIKINLDNNKISIEAKNSEHDVFNASMDCLYNGDKLEIGFNVTYLIDAIAKIKDDNADIMFTDNFSSVLIDSNHVVMPMRI